LSETWRSGSAVVTHRIFILEVGRCLSAIESVDEVVEMVVFVFGEDAVGDVADVRRESGVEGLAVPSLRFAIATNDVAHVTALDVSHPRIRHALDLTVGVVGDGLSVELFDRRSLRLLAIFSRDPATTIRDRLGPFFVAGVTGFAQKRWDAK
jgi:hypothetical protein